MTYYLCSLHDNDADWHEAADPVGIIPALGHADGTWEPMGPPTVCGDRACAVGNGIEPERIVDLSQVPT